MGTALIVRVSSLHFGLQELTKHAYPTTRTHAVGHYQALVLIIDNPINTIQILRVVQRVD